MLLAVDVGNTNSVFSVSKEKKILSEWRCSTDGNMTADQYFTWLKQLFSIANISDVFPLPGGPTKAKKPRLKPKPAWQ